MKTVYLDNNATTKTAPEVVEAMLPYFTEKYGNASSMHTFGGAVGHDVEAARKSVAALLGAAHADEIIFTSCGSESDNTALFSAVRSYPGKRHIVTTRVEHPAVLNTCKYLQSQGYGVTYLPVDGNGMISLQDLEAAVTAHTALVSVMMANNETGVVFPVEEAARIAKSRGALFHTDAVQTAGKLPIDLKNSRIDMLSISGHKLHAPKGIGALYVRRGTRFVPFLIGGHQEHSRRAGTENVPYIIGLGKACELARAHMSETGRIAALRDRLEHGITAAVPNVRVNGGGSPRLPTTLNISFEFIEGEAILLHLSDLGIAASSGSACTSGSLEPSHVLRAMGVPFTFAHGSIRFSLSVYNTGSDIDFVLAELPPVIMKLRAMSPFWHEAQGKACRAGAESL
ncbi:MAG: cysteine desulfurase NifS [Elusimicrobiaceae bacterium]|nr:cysteine desulfurase NifS [Elusimicrobiaceae bacterium]